MAFRIDERAEKLYRLKVLGIIAVLVAVIGVLAYDRFTEASPSSQTVVISELNDELTIDPETVGYAGMTDFEAAVALNTVGLTGQTVSVASVDATLIQSAVVGSEYLALTAAQRDLWAALLQAASGGAGVPVIDLDIRGQVLAIWGPGTVTRANLGALQTRSASRAEFLWGDGTNVTVSEVQEARLLP
jgi:hypothetical protein